MMVPLSTVCMVLLVIFVNIGAGANERITTQFTAQIGYVIEQVVMVITKFAESMIGDLCLAWPTQSIQTGALRLAARKNSSHCELEAFVTQLTFSLPKDGID